MNFRIAARKAQYMHRFHETWYAVRVVTLDVACQILANYSYFKKQTHDIIQ